VISVAKKKELAGDFKNHGREWQAKGQPEAMRVHDFEISKPGQGKTAGVCGVRHIAQERSEGSASAGVLLLRFRSPRAAAVSFQRASPTAGAIASITRSKANWTSPHRLRIGGLLGQVVAPGETELPTYRRGIHQPGNRRLRCRARTSSARVSRPGPLSTCYILFLIDP
jgi:hypothetical protein